MSRSLVPQSERKGLVPLSEALRGGVWDLEFKVGNEHQYIWLSTPHCEAHIAAMSIDGITREFAAILAPGGSTNLDERDAAIVGSLPFAGIASIDLLSISNEGEKELRHAVVLNRAYYFEDVPAGTYTIRVRLGLNAGGADIPATTYDRKSPLAPFMLRRDITLADLAK